MWHFTYTGQRKNTQITKRIPLNRLLQQQVFYMTLTTEDNALHIHNTNPATAECRRSGCIHNTSRRIASFSSIRLDESDRHPLDFKYLHNQKSTAVKSGDRGGQGNLQHLLMILFSPNVCIRNAFALCILVHIDSLQRF